MILTRSQKVLLRAIQAHSGQWNWYKLGRACLGDLDSPADFTLTPLIEAGFVEEKPFENESLPRLHITTTGEAALQNSESHDPNP